MTRRDFLKGAAALAAGGVAGPALASSGDLTRVERPSFVVPGLSPAHDGLRAPTVAVLGNHDHWLDARGIARALGANGYAVLRNQSTTFALRGEPFTVIGVDDLLTGNADPSRAMAGARTGSRLVLAHGPKTAEDLGRRNLPLLCLSGHTHGGQISIPGFTSFMLRTLAREPYDRGLFRVGPVQLYVNRGIGNSAFRLRVNSAPEVTLATLRSPEVVAT